MTKRKIKSGNKLIFEFLYGKDWVDNAFKNNRVEGPDWWMKACALQGDYENMKFHQYWDYLIPIIAKIRDLPENDWIFSEGREQYTKIWKEWALLDIEIMYEKTIDYLKWYNNVTSKSKCKRRK